jgi:antibiotic biosynthesis monooxygenase (ABM) superfamily enzyme
MSRIPSAVHSPSASATGQTPSGASLRPDRLRQFLVTLLGVYPIITLILYLVLPLTSGWQIWQTTLIVAPVMVAIMVFWMIPAIQKYFGRFIMHPARR